MRGELPAHAVVLAGGRGTRFWPLSRRAHPKQLLDLTGAGSLLSLTLERLDPLVPPQRQWIITNADLVDAVAEQAPQVPREQIIGEPTGRNTAPAVGLAAALLEERHGAVPFAVLPSDHLITPASAFREALDAAFRLVSEDDWFLTFGVPPSRPETGYGYIEVGEPLPAHPEAFRVARFTEKPDHDTARRYLEGGRHLWNSGIFVWRSDVVLAGLRQHLPTTTDAIETCVRSAKLGTEAFAPALQKAYAVADSISIDYALMEKSEKVAVLPAEFGWNDVGQWLAMREIWPRDEEGHAHVGQVLSVDSRDCIVYGPERLTALLGVDDLVVVHTPDATLVARASRSQDLKSLLQKLEDEGADDKL
jgi:mannose-1-phosphate guanylyltransferase